MLKDFYRKAMDVVFVNFLWIITSLLGVFLTLGAATAAMFRVIYKIINYDEPTSVLKEFITGFKENFKIGTIVWLILVILAIPLYFMYIYSLQNGIDFLFVIGIVCAYQWLLFFIYFFPTLSLFKTENNFKLIKNVFLLQNINICTKF